MNEMIEYRAVRVDLKKLDTGAMIVALTDKGQVVIHLTESELETLVRQTKLLQSASLEQPDRLWDKD